MRSSNSRLLAHLAGVNGQTAPFRGAVPAVHATEPGLPESARQVIADDSSPLRGETWSPREMLSWLSAGVIVCDARRRILYVNEAAGEALGAGAPLKLSAGVFSATTCKDQKRLTRRIEAAALGEPGIASLVVGEKPQDVFSVAVCRLANHGMAGTLLAERASGRWLAMVTFEPTPPFDAARPLLEELGLGAAEARLAVALAAGSSLADYATNHGISINTVRTHLARLKSKLDCRTQADVVRRVFRLVPRTRRLGP